MSHSAVSVGPVCSLMQGIGQPGLEPSHELQNLLAVYTTAKRHVFVLHDQPSSHTEGQWPSRTDLGRHLFTGILSGEAP